MDRLHVVIIGAGLLASACGGDGSAGDKKEEPTARSRVASVEAKAEAPVELSEFCEVYPSTNDAPAMTWPALTGEPPAASGQPRWVNVWATWCKPCIEELPRLATWKDEIGKQHPYELVFLSGDGDPEAVAAFAADHPPVQGSLEISDAAALTPWLASLGAGEAPVLPVHVFVDGKDRVRCVRTAGIGDGDRKAVEQLLMQL
jgi:thiol-disulfide isomerase/thioredoxin